MAIGTLTEPISNACSASPTTGTNTARARPRAMAAMIQTGRNRSVVPSLTGGVTAVMKLQRDIDLGRY
ncbi:hypothetical protein ACFPRL_20490 [Pseudoclavibacter helvolus]